MAQIISITSEALQATIRRLLPSQQGFGEDLQASNVVQPIIDLTPTAEGSQLQENLAEAWALNSITAWSVSDSTSTIVNSPGFWRVWGTATNNNDSVKKVTASLDLTDGFSTTNLWKFIVPNLGTGQVNVAQFDTIVFLGSGESLTATSNGVESEMAGSLRQVADSTGNIVNPSGFSFE